MPDIFDEIESRQPDIFDQIEYDPDELASFGLTSEEADSIQAIGAPAPAGTMRGLAGSAQRGWYALQSIPEVIQAVNTREPSQRPFYSTSQDFPGTALGMQDFETPHYIQPPIETAEDQESRRQWHQATLGELGKLQTASAATPKSLAQENLAGATGQSEKWKAWLTDPIELTTSIALESLPPTIGGAAAGAPLGPGGVVAGIGAASALTEYSSSLLGAAGELGYDVRDPDSLGKFLESPDFDKANSVALTRGTVIGSFDAASGGMAGKFVGPAVKQGLKSALKGTAKELGTQAAFGAGGELVGQVASGQPIDVFDIAMEGIAEMAGAPVEVGTKLYAEQRAAPAVAEAAPSAVAEATPLTPVTEPAKPNEATTVLTPSQIESSTPEQQGGLKHNDGIVYGLTVGTEAVPELEAQYDAAGKAMMAAFNAGDDAAIAAAMGRNNYYGGALQGATRGQHKAAAVNYAKFVKENGLKNYKPSFVPVAPKPAAAAPPTPPTVTEPAATVPTPPSATPPGMTLLGPVQDRSQTRTSKSALGGYQYVAQTEKARTEYANKLADHHGDDFQGAFDEMVRIDDTAFQSVVASELLARQLEKLGKSNVAQKLELERNVRLLTPRILNQKTEAGQALQAQQQVNERIAPYAALLSYMDLVRTRFTDTAKKAAAILQKKRSKRAKPVATPEDEATNTEEQYAERAEEALAEEAAALEESANKLNEAEKSANGIIDQLATSQSDTLKWSKRTVDGVRETLKWYLLGDIRQQEFQATLDSLKVRPEIQDILLKTAQREQQIRDTIDLVKQKDSRLRAQNEAEMRTLRAEALKAFREGMEPERQADSVLNKLAEAQSDTPAADKPKKINEVRATLTAFLKGDITEQEFTATLATIGLGESYQTRLLNAAKREAQIRDIVDYYEARSKLAKQLKIDETSEAGIRLLDLAQKATSAPKGLVRNRHYREMVDILHNEVAQGKIDVNDLLRDVWYGSVLARAGTMLNVGIGSLASGLTFSASAAADRLARGHPRQAIDIIGRFITGIYEGALMFGPIVSRGDYTMLPDFEERTQRILSGKGRSDALETLWKRGGAAGIFPGGLAFTRRMMTALDYIGAQGTEDAILLYSALTREDQESIQALARRHDKAASKAAEVQAKEEMGPKASRIEIIKRKKEILEVGVSKEVRANALEIARRAAANAEPRGIPGAIHSFFSGAPWWLKAVGGFGFLRSAMNMVGNASNMFPGIGAVTYARAKLFDKLPDGHPFKKWGLDLPIEQQRLVATMQVLSLGMTGALAALFLSGDDEEDKKLQAEGKPAKGRNLEISGSWLGMSVAEKRALQDVGQKPNSVRFGKKGPWLSYRQLPFAGPLAIIGNMRDAQRFRAEKWNEESALRQIVNGWLSGLFYIKDMSTLSGLALIFGGAGDTRDDLEDLDKQFNRYAADSAGRFAGGFIPSVLKEVDDFSYNYLHRPAKDSALDYWIKNIPVVRQLQGHGPALNMFGEPVVLDRPPFRSWLGGGDKGPLFRAVSEKMEKGVFPPVPSPSAKIQPNDGELRQMTPKEVYDYQKRHGAILKREIEENLTDFIRMTPEDAQQFYDAIQQRIGREARGSMPAPPR